MEHRYTLTPEQSPSEGVYSAVAAVEDCSPLDLPPLAGAADPEALNVLLMGDSKVDRVSFEYAGYEVTATTEEIYVREQGDR